MLLNLYYPYRRSPKRLRELNFFSEMYENTILKPYIVKCPSTYAASFITHLQILQIPN